MPHLQSRLAADCFPPHLFIISHTQFESFCRERGKITREWRRACVCMCISQEVLNSRVHGHVLICCEHEHKGARSLYFSIYRPSPRDGSYHSAFTGEWGGGDLAEALFRVRCSAAQTTPPRSRRLVRPCRLNREDTHTESSMQKTGGKK